MTNFTINEIPQKTSLIRGDCFEVFKNSEFCKDNSVDLILSDPPYGVNFSKIQGDKKEDVVSWIPTFMQECYQVLKDNSYCVLFVGVKNIENWIIAGKDAGFEFKNIVATRAFNNGSCVPKNNFGFQFQPILVFSKGSGKTFNQVDFIPTSEGWFNDKRNKNPKPYTYAYPNWIKTEWAFATEKRASKNFHPTEKNVKLLKFFIELMTDEGSIIFDPFMGAGSTGLATIKAGNRYFKGIELDEKYYDIAFKRMKELNEKY